MYIPEESSASNISYGGIAFHARAAFILAGCNLGLALVPLLLRRQSKPGPSELMVREIRDMALEEVSRDLDKVTTDVAAVGAAVSHLKSGVSGFAGEGMKVLGPFLGMAINLLKKKKEPVA